LSKEIKHAIGIKSSVVEGGDKYDILLNRLVSDDELDDKEAVLAVGADSIAILGQKENFQRMLTLMSVLQRSCRRGKQNLTSWS